MFYGKVGCKMGYKRIAGVGGIEGWEITEPLQTVPPTPNQVGMN